MLLRFLKLFFVKPKWFHKNCTGNHNHDEERSNLPQSTGEISSSNKHLWTSLPKKHLTSSDVQQTSKRLSLLPRIIVYNHSDIQSISWLHTPSMSNEVKHVPHSSLLTLHNLHIWSSKMPLKCVPRSFLWTHFLIPDFRSWVPVYLHFFGRDVQGCHARGGLHGGVLRSELGCGVVWCGVLHYIV